MRAYINIHARAYNTHTHTERASTAAILHMCVFTNLSSKVLLADSKCLNRRVVCADLSDGRAVETAVFRDFLLSREDSVAIRSLPMDRN